MTKWITAVVMHNKEIGFFKAYGTFWKYYANFGSRTSKEVFWKAYLLHGIFILATLSPIYYVYDSIIVRGDLSARIWLAPLIIYSLVTIVPTIALIVRRLNDTDRNGCWLFLFLVPFAGQVIFFIMLTKPSSPYDVYPGRSGEGPYGQPQNPYAPPQNPYAPPQNPYALPQNPYTLPFQYYRPLPPPRKYAPQAGGNKAALAIVLSIIITATSGVYGLVCNDYLYNNFDRYIETLFGDMFGTGIEGFYENPYGWGNDPWAEENPGGYGYPWDNDDNWNDDPGYYWGEEEQTPEEEAAIIDFVRESTLWDFNEFTIEEVLLSHIDEYTIEWECAADYSGTYPIYFIYVSGTAIDDFVSIYASFDVYDDGTIEIFNLDDGERDEYYEDALEMYGEWYANMMSGIGSSNTA